MMQDIQGIIKRISKIEHGFKHVDDEAKKIVVSKASKDIIILSDELLKSEIYQVRSLAVFLLGYISSKNPSVLKTLKNKVSRDSNWRVQEILAKAFDQYCKDVSYENALPTIQEWLNDKNPNVCRAVTEGLRIWTNRPYFKYNPHIAIELIAQHKASDSEYLRKSVGNSLRDISRKYKILIEKELSTWDLSDKRISFTYKYVTKNKKNN